VGYQPIEGYGIIGDLHTVALVSKVGSIDFISFPRFDSPTLCALLDDEHGARFSFRPFLEDATSRSFASSDRPDPRFTGTVRAITENLVDDSLVYR